MGLLRRPLRGRAGLAGFAGPAGEDLRSLPVPPKRAAAVAATAQETVCVVVLVDDYQREPEGARQRGKSRRRA